MFIYIEKVCDQVQDAKSVHSLSEPASSNPSALSRSSSWADEDAALVPSTFMINYSQLPTQWFDHCLDFYEMKYIRQSSEMYLISSQGFISLQFHFYFIPTQPFISFSSLLYFIPISFLPSYLFHCLPKAISLTCHCCFIACLGQYLWYFMACLGCYLWYFIAVSLLA